jgi:transcriptional regulator with XRE-family HTH domain
MPWLTKERHKYNREDWARARANPHRHKRMLTRVIRSLRKRLALSQHQLGRALGVSLPTIANWERTNGTYPRKYRWRRIRELWKLSKELRNEEYWKDRDEPPSFYD